MWRKKEHCRKVGQASISKRNYRIVRNNSVEKGYYIRFRQIQGGVKVAGKENKELNPIDLPTDKAEEKALLKT
jgi:hypothetical protein